MTEQYNSDRQEPSMDEVFMSMNNEPTNTDTCWVPLTVSQMKAIVERLNGIPDLNDEERGAEETIEDFLSAFTDPVDNPDKDFIVVMERHNVVLEVDSIDG